MSDYYNASDPIARGRYTDKLELLGLSDMEDPYVLLSDDN